MYVGTCGWSYDDWKEVFYPNALKQQNFLEFYSNIFQTVEIDSSFYHIPNKNSVAMPTIKGLAIKYITYFQNCVTYSFN